MKHNETFGNWPLQILCIYVCIQMCTGVYGVGERDTIEQGSGMCEWKRKMRKDSRMGGQ